MREPTDRPLPGSTLLKFARLLFDERVLSAVVLPTLADLQREVADAGPSRSKRARARWRGYRAFWTLVLVAPFAFWQSPARESGTIAFPDALGRLAIASIVATLLAIVGPVLGAWTALVAAGGALFAIVIHAWYERHPSDVPTPEEPRWRCPEINFSSTRISGNIGGLIFMVGSLFIIVLGLPALLWFLLAGMAGGFVVGRALLAWHGSHPTRGLPENRIVLR